MRMGRALLLPVVLTMLGCVAEPSVNAPGAPRPVPIGGDAGTECAHPEEGCACDPARPPIDCYLDAIVGEDGSITCNAGTRYCRDAVWTGCEAIREFVLPAGPAALITGPDACNPCDPRCFVSRDTPTPGDLTTDNSSGVSYDPDRGGIEITPDAPSTGGLPDSDGDGVPDVADECPGAGFIRNPDGSCFTDTALYHTLPYGSTAIDPLVISTQIRTADVYFLMDTTGSMGGEITRLRTDLTSGTFIPGCAGGIIGAIRCTIPDAWFGVGYFDDYPVSPYGGSGDFVYRNLLDIQSSVASAQTAVNGLALHWGNDGPESNTQALWAVATGGGLSTYLAARTSCPAGTWGYPCFRPGTIPIVVHITDAPFHNGPSNSYPYCIGGTLSTALPPATPVLNTNERMDNTAYPGGGAAVDITGRWLSFSGSTSWMANDYSYCGSSSSRDAVFRVRLTSTQPVTFTTQGSSFNTMLYVIRASDGGGWCNNDYAGLGAQSRLDLTLPAGDYFVIVDGVSSSTRGSYRLTMGTPVASCSGYAGASWNDTVTALSARGVRTITVQTCGDWSSGYCLEGESHARTLGNATGALGSSGSPYVFRGNADGSGLSRTIVDAIVDLANYSRMDVTARAVGDTMGFTDLPIQATSWGPAGSCTGISGGTTFVQCLPGTDVNFTVTFRNDVVMPTTVPQVFTFYIEVIGDGTIVLARVPVRIVVPAAVALYPASARYWRDYDSTLRCEINERPDWNALAWSADIPAGTRIEFELRAASTAAALATATPIARITTPTAVSPRDIATALRAVGYPDGMQHLRITAVLHANADRTASPALRSMEVSYDCLPSE